MVRMCNTLSMISTRCHLTDIFLLCIQPENTYGAICNNKQFRTKNNNKIGCSKKLVLIIYNNRKSVYCNMQQSVVQIADFRRSQAGAEIRTALIAVGAPCLCDLSRNESNQTSLCICTIRIFVRHTT